MKRPRLARLMPRLAIAELRTAPPPPNRADAELLTPAHRAWRAIVIARAGARCEWIERGARCERSEAAGDRMFAHHIHERSDGGALDDPNNGQCLCGRHHTLITNLARARRHIPAAPARRRGGQTPGEGVLIPSYPSSSNRDSPHGEIFFSKR